MTKQRTKSFSKISLLVVALVLALCSALSLSNFAVFADENEGISWVTKITITYIKDQEITIDGKVYKNIPLTTNAKIVYKVIGNDGKLQEREIDVTQATINGIKNDATKDRITFEGFSTSDNIDTSKKTVDRTMTMKFIPANSSREFTLKIEYTVYTSEDAVKGMEQLINILTVINNVLDNILAPLLIVMASIGMIFAIFLGMKLAKANNAEEREEAKKRVIYTVIGIAVCIALIIVFKLFARFSIEWFGDANFFELPISK